MATAPALSGCLTTCPSLNHSDQGRHGVDVQYVPGEIRGLRISGCRTQACPGQTRRTASEEAAHGNVKNQEEPRRSEPRRASPRTAKQAKIFVQQNLDRRDTDAARASRPSSWSVWLVRRFGSRRKSWQEAQAELAELEAERA